MATNQPVELPQPTLAAPPRWAGELFVAGEILVAAVVLIWTLSFYATRSPRDVAAEPAWRRHVSSACRTEECLSPRQFITADQATLMKIAGRDRVLVVDIRAPSEPVAANPRIAADVHAPSMERGMPSRSNPIAQAPELHFRLDFGTRVDEALRAASLGHDQPVILTSPSVERAALAALLLQERGYTRILIVND